MNVRRATPDDVPTLLAISLEGMETYREWAGPAWEPPPADEFDALAPWASDGGASWFVIEEDGEPIAHALLLPAARSRLQSDDPTLGHVVQVFVRPSHWGTAAGRTVFKAVVDDAPRLGLTHLVLWTPAEQHRARRFYEREGWRLAGRDDDTPLGFPVVEYRLECPTQS